MAPALWQTWRLAPGPELTQRASAVYPTPPRTSRWPPRRSNAGGRCSRTSTTTTKRGLVDDGSGVRARHQRPAAGLAQRAGAVALGKASTAAGLVGTAGVAGVAAGRPTPLRPAGGAVSGVLRHASAPRPRQRGCQSQTGDGRP